MGDRLIVHKTGIASLQDLGRSGVACLGVSSNGAVDAYSTRAANALLGNDATNPVVEITAMPMTFSVSTSLVIAVTGATADVTVAGEHVPQWSAVRVGAGDEVCIRNIRAGLRCYVGLHARVEAARFLDSVAPDRALGFGRQLRRDDEVLLTPMRHRVRTDVHQPAGFVPAYGSPWTLPMCAGPEWSTVEDIREDILAAKYTVDAKSNHVGIRISADLPRVPAAGELLSRGVAIGAVELTPSGELIVLHRGRSVTAGYPIIAVVTSHGLSAAGQVRPGDRVRLDLCSIEDAVATYRRHRRLLDQVTAAARIGSQDA